MRVRVGLASSTQSAEWPCLNYNAQRAHARNPGTHIRSCHIPGLPLSAVVEAGLGDAAGELALLDREVDHIAGLVLGAVAGLLPGDAVARVGLRFLQELYIGKRKKKTEISTTRPPNRIGH